MIDIDRIREDTPGVSTITHLNSAGAGLMPRPVIEAIQSYITYESMVGGYAAVEYKQYEFEKLYQLAAQFLGCNADEIAFTGSATDSYNRALSAIPFQLDDIILTTSNDYSSNQIAFLGLAKRYGVKIYKINDTENGELDLDDLRVKLHTLRPRLLAITHIPTNSGLIQPIKEAGDIVRNYDTLYLIDACQTIGQLGINCQLLNCDFLSATMRKFLRGPRGMGVLYVSKKTLDLGYEPLLLDMHGARWTDEFHYEPVDSAKRFEDWEFSFALLKGCKAAFSYAMEIGMDKIEERNTMLKNHLLDRIRDVLPQARILDRGSQLANIVTLDIPGFTASDIKNQLRERKVNVSASPLGAGLLDFRRKGVDGALRLSPHYYNTTEEIDFGLQIIAEIIGK